MTEAFDVRDIDPEFRDALHRALEERPEELREFLARQGYLEPDEDADEIVGNEQELSESERHLLGVVEELASPHSTQQIINVIQREDQYESLRNQYESLKHRPWVSDKLNKLVRKGRIGRYRDGRTVMYTSDPAEAIRHWALHNNRFVDELSGSDIDEIVSATNMNRETVRAGLYELIDRE
ncbi:hypothetical protein [Halocalculus aciditolerans]|uniref:Uncharacterized protein n=1 Tax=Halocalculus aciditolerans TaxID=1383812 RepID=A0A830FLQ8_9EURY|nr:hypothetical protein [Halocalculus aciditolerans]GGL68129.1 hypothetical protein GCM10009039_27670 [Halocalculus aciditolerans]